MRFGSPNRGPWVERLAGKSQGNSRRRLISSPRLIRVTAALALSLSSCSDAAGSGGGGAGTVAQDCTRLVPLRIWVTEPSAVAVLFTPENCTTHVPLTGLVNSDFVVLEDGEALSSEAHRDVLTDRGYEVEVALLLDVSDSTTPVRADVIAGATSVIDELLVTRGLASKVRVGLWVFDGGPAPTAIQLPISDADRLRARLQTLANFEATDGGATNLNGAVRQGVTSQQERLVTRMVENAGGVAATGHLIVFTDGGDSAARETAAGAVETVASARTLPKSSAPGTPAGVVQTWAVTLRGEDYDQAALRELVGESRYLLEAGSSSELAGKFSAVADQIGAQVAGTFLFAYCSAKRADSHTVEVRLRDGLVSQSEGFEVPFSADGFEGGCDAAFFASACDAKECGGLACGACDPETEQCNTSSLQCRPL